MLIRLVMRALIALVVLAPIFFPEQDLFKWSDQAGRLRTFMQPFAEPCFDNTQEYHEWFDQLEYGVKSMARKILEQSLKQIMKMFEAREVDVKSADRVNLAYGTHGVEYKPKNKQPTEETPKEASQFQ